MSRYTKWVAWQTRISFIGIEIIAALITGAALADRLFGLGWGYEWRAVFIGVGTMAFTGILHLLCKGIYSSVR